MSKQTGYWLKLRHAPGLGPVGIQKLLNHFGDAANICSADQQTLRLAGIPQPACEFLLSHSLPANIEKELEWAAAPARQIITFADPLYPAQLKRIHNPPPVLYAIGDPKLLSEPQLAIIGSRSPTQSGQETAYEFSKALTKTGLIINSGLALGIDGAAHQGALAAGGPTIAVLATGVNHIYPATHSKLAAKIVENGVIISEMPLGTKPLAELFPQRNRIISGLSLGVLVVEAAKKSGSLITARLAMEQAREVFAIPGSIHNPLARGCHMLLRQGAKLVESVKDILEELAPQLRHAINAADSTEVADDKAATLDSKYKHLLQFIDYDPLSVDRIVERSGLSVQEVGSMLLILELEGHIGKQPGGLYCRTH